MSISHAVPALPATVQARALCDHAWQVLRTTAMHWELCALEAVRGPSHPRPVVVLDASRCAA